MKLRTLVALYFKARVVSWLMNSANTVFITTTAGQGHIAGFVNGRYAELEAYAVPSFVPPEWAQPTTEEGKEGEEGEEEE